MPKVWVEVLEMAQFLVQILVVIFVPLQYVFRIGRSDCSGWPVTYLRLYIPFGFLVAFLCRSLDTSFNLLDLSTMHPHQRQSLIIKGSRFIVQDLVDFIWNKIGRDLKFSSNPCLFYSV